MALVTRCMCVGVYESIGKLKGASEKLCLSSNLLFPVTVQVDEVAAAAAAVVVMAVAHCGGVAATHWKSTLSPSFFYLTVRFLM